MTCVYLWLFGSIHFIIEMKLLLLSVALSLFQGSIAPPVTPDKTENHEEQVNLDFIHYSKYLKQVVELLENDEHFKQRLQNASEDDIRSGKVAEDLHFVNHTIRSLLDERKRHEIERLRKLASKKNSMSENLDSLHKDYKDHLVAENPKFEIEDLKRLIRKTAATLEEADKSRKEEFKAHEMQKKNYEEEKLKNMTDTEKYIYEQEQRKIEARRSKHAPVHHPGSKQQLEEVWEQQDHMEQEFNPKVFFAMHDLDGNNMWDQEEVKALFIKEINKLYDPNDPTIDLREKYEEMERMREHVFRENDLDRDGFISYAEFVSQIGRPEFQRDEGWKPISENEIYTAEEYNEFKRRHQQELEYQQRMMHHQNVPVPPIHQQQYYPDQFAHQAYQQHPGNQQPPVAQQNYHPSNTGYQPPPQGQPPQAYHSPQNFQQTPQGNNQPPQGYQPQSYQPPQQQGGNQPQGYKQPQGPQANSLPQGYPSPQGNNPPQGYASPQGNNPPQGYGSPQGNNPPQGYPSPQGNNPPQGYPSPQGNNPPQGYPSSQGNNPPQGYPSPQGNNPPQGYQSNNQVPQSNNHQPPQGYEQKPMQETQFDPHPSNQLRQDQAFQTQGQNPQALPQKKPLAGGNINSYQTVP